MASMTFAWVPGTPTIWSWKCGGPYSEVAIQSTPFALRRLAASRSIIVAFVDTVMCMP